MDWRDIPSLTALRAFEAAARLGSYSEAAQALNVTHAAIAQHVRGLETHVGQKLMQRAGRGVEPTEAGFRLARDLHSGFSEIALGVRSVMRDTDGGPLSLTTTQSFAENWLMPRIAQFWAAHPEVPITVTVENRVVDLTRSEHHLGIRYGHGHWPGHDADYLTDAQRVIVATPALAAQLPDGLDPTTDEGRAKLAALPWVMDIQYGEFYAWLVANGLHPDTLNRTDFASPSLVLAACRAGAGVSVQSFAVVEGDLDDGRLVAISMPNDDPTLAYYIVRPPGPQPDMVKLFVRWLKSVR